MTDCEIVKFGIYLWTFPTGRTYEINTAETGPNFMKKNAEIRLKCYIFMLKPPFWVDIQPLLKLYRSTPQIFLGIVMNKKDMYIFI